VNVVTPEVVPRVGESFFLKRVLINSEKEAKEPTQRKSVFRTISKLGGKYCNIFFDSGSTNDLVFIEMVENLGLKKKMNPTPYKVS
jgi:hypothetical protein